MVALLVALVVLLGWAAPAQAAPAFTASFTTSTPDAYTTGSKTDLTFHVTGKLPAKADVLVLAWSDARMAMMDDFAHTVREQPWKVDAAALDKLPDGRNQLQLLTRVNGRIVAKATHWIQKTTPVAKPEYSIALGSVPSVYTVGQGQPIAVTVPALPERGDVLVLAWHHDEKRMVEAFAHTLSNAPFQISPAQLDKLPAGRVQLQVKLRRNNRPIEGAEREMTVVRPVPLPEIDFANAPGTYTLGSTEPVALAVDGELPKNAELIVQAWDEAANATIASFTHALDGGPFHIGAAKLNTLPPGRIRLQAMLRFEGEIKLTVGHTLEIVRPVVEEVLPTVAFVSAPGEYVRGSGAGISLSLSGPLPEGGDVLVLAWSDARKRMVDSFAQKFTKGPITIPAAKLDTLDAGGANLQALVRINNKIKSRVTHDLEITEPVIEEPDPAVSVSFAPGSPAVHPVGAGNPIYFNLSGPLGEGEDVLAIAWSNEQRKMVSGFSRQFTGAPHRIEAAWLDTFPSGAVQLQLLLRKDNRIVQKITHWVLIVRPGGDDTTGGDDDNGDGNGGGDDGNGSDDGGGDGTGGGDDNTGGDNGNGGDTGSGDDNTGGNDDDGDVTEPGHGGSGWTTFSKSRDTRVIYVDADTPGVNDSYGDDKNDGSSPDKAVKSPRRAHELARDGYPDWVLFKRGDVWRESIGTWEKSGRSADQMMLVSSYGDANAARPRFEVSGEDGLSYRGGNGTIKHVAFVDLHIYAYKRDPNNSAFNGGRSKEFGIRWWGACDNLLFEGLLVEYFASNVDLGANQDKREIDNVTFRRCVIRNAFSPNDVSHSQGMGAGNVDGLNLIENVFYHNGWNDKVSRGHRTMFNHNIYLHQCSDVLVERNIWAQGATLAIKLRSDGAGRMKNVTVRDNFFVDSKECVGMGGEALSGGASSLNLENVKILRNVATMIGEPPTRDQIGRAFILKQVGPARVEDNIIVHKTYPTTWCAIEVGGDRPWKDIKVTGNVIHEWKVSSPERWFKGPSGVAKQNNLVNQKDSMFADASRTMEKYLQVRGVSNLEAFLDKCGDQRIGHYDENYTAEKAMQYFRQGFTLVPHD